MKLDVTDYNGADLLVRRVYSPEWNQLKAAAESLPLHLKSSDQAGIKGSPIFDPIGTNSFLRRELHRVDWQTNIPIPLEYRFLGTDVDFGKDGVIVEVQFSNYPFLLNNTLRCELFYKGQFQVGKKNTGLAIIITKAGLFPASNSTLYYEQAKKQLDALAQHKVFTVPLRLIGLTAEPGKNIPVFWTVYRKARYSRTIKSQGQVVCEITAGVSAKSRCKIILPQRN